MFTSFASALSALSAQAIAVDVVGNNLANVNTPGFKNSTVYFRDLVTQAMGSSGGELQVGLGVGRPITVRQFAQGSIQASGRSLDAAIQGDGFFITRSKAGNTLYTRSGNFQVDLDGHLLTATGERVQGWTADPLTGAVNTSGTVSDIMLTGGSLKPPRVDHAVLARPEPGLLGHGRRRFHLLHTHGGLRFARHRARPDRVLHQDRPQHMAIRRFDSRGRGQRRNRRRAVSDSGRKRDADLQPGRPAHGSPARHAHRYRHRRAQQRRLRYEHHLGPLHAG